LLHGRVFGYLDKLVICIEIYTRRGKDQQITEMRLNQTYDELFVKRLNQTYGGSFQVTGLLGMSPIEYLKFKCAINN
jgi:hypothetical protein